MNSNSGKARDYSPALAGQTRSPVSASTELRAENSRLKKKLSHLQFMSTLTIGIALIAAGGASLVVSYVFSSVVLTLAGLGLVFWGVTILYISPSKYVPEKVLSLLSLSTIKSIDRMLINMNYRGKTIFVHPRHLKGLAQGYVFIPYDSSFRGTLPNEEQLAEERMLYEDPKGIFMVAPSQGLVDLVEDELDINLATVDMEYLKENVPKLLTNNLRIVDSITIQELPGSVRIDIVGDSAAKLCKAVSKETLIGNHFGCPLCSSLALMISKVLGKPVAIQENKANDIDGTIASTYRIIDRA